jgi:hypothetical protein
MEQQEIRAIAKALAASSRPPESFQAPGLTARFDSHACIRRAQIIVQHRGASTACVVTVPVLEAVPRVPGAEALQLNWIACNGRRMPPLDDAAWGIPMDSGICTVEVPGRLVGGMKIGSGSQPGKLPKLSVPSPDLNVAIRLIASQDETISYKTRSHLSLNAT